MISVIIPVYNEEGVIGNTIRHLKTACASDQLEEIIVVDGGSADHSFKEAQEAGARAIKSTRKGRAAQMNEGAKVARGSILYFLHADSLPPSSLAYDITAAVKNGYPAGCYRLRFDMDHWFLRTNAWFTRFNVNAFRYGDQSLFVTRELFHKTGGFCEDHVVMEDYDMVARLRKHGNFGVIPKYVTTSARKYVLNGVFRMQGVFYLIYIMYRLGYSQKKIVSIFRKLVRQDKV